MIRNSFLLCVCWALCSACGDSSDASPASNTCPDVSGTWTITDHCSAPLIGLSTDVTETGCSLSFSAPFDAFSGNVTSDGKITISGPQSCTGTASASAIAMNCTGGADTCEVKLSR